jgi:hypothetical protein
LSRSSPVAEVLSDPPVQLQCESALRYIFSEAESRAEMQPGNQTVALKFLKDVTKLFFCLYVSIPVVLDFIFSPWPNSPPVEQGFLIIEASQ